MQNSLVRLLKWQAGSVLKKSGAKVVVVSGSIGKTSTTQAIATILQESFVVVKTLKNYNTDIGVPCSILGNNLPNNLRNPFSWLLILAKNQYKLIRKLNTEVFVLELGADKPGDLREFSWLNPDIGVVTAVSPEHMEFFETLELVAIEELSIAEYCDKTIINKRMVDDKYLNYANTDELFNYDRSDIAHIGLETSDLNVVGDHSVDAIAAGLAVGKSLGMKDSDLIAGTKKVVSQPGRMNILGGVNDSILIDDTYNSSPEAAIAALDYLYTLEVPQKIALLGSMNELGLSSVKEHKKVGDHCDPKNLDLAVTLGEDANNYLATNAKKNGCRVITTQNPYEAAQVILENMMPGAAVLLKGSQNKVFAEEAVKIMLRDPEDESKLVRRGKFWDKKRQQSFRNGQ